MTNLIQTTKNILREHIWLAIVVALHCISVATIILLYHDDIIYSLWAPIKSIAKMTSVPFGIIVGAKINYIMFKKPVEERKELFKQLSTQACYAIAAVAIITPTLIYFTFLKYSIMYDSPETFDVKFAAIDKFLHFNIQPSVIAHSIFTNPVAIGFLGFCYCFWMKIMYVYAIFQTFRTKQAYSRMRYLISFALCWILLGNVVASLLPSVGPCYFEDILKISNPDFIGIMDKVRNLGDLFSMGVVNAQDKLLSNHLEDKKRFAHAISAMPSLHVAIAFLMFLASKGFGKFTRRAFGVYFVSILIGSVFYGWHYAIDGYVSIIGVLIIWKFVGWALLKDPHFKAAYEKEQITSISELTEAEERAEPIPKLETDKEEKIKEKETVAS